MGVRRLVTMGNWPDTWDCMEKECKQEVVSLPYSALRETLDQYLKKHKFCSQCKNTVNRAYTLLVEEGKEPAIAAGEKPADSDPTINYDGSFNLYSGISACNKESHVHVRCDPKFISQLFTLAEPELSGLNQERHVKTIEIAQKEVLICIGIALFERFQRIQQKIKEGEFTCDLLLLVCLKSLRRSVDMAAERKRAADIDLLCQELELDEKRKEGRRERKRKQRVRKREEKNNSSGRVDDSDSDVASMASCDSGRSSSQSQLCEASKSVAKECNKHHREEREFDKEKSPKFWEIPVKTGSSYNGRKEDLILRPLPRPVLSLVALLEEEEEEGEEEETIPMEEIRSFYDTKEETALRRQELRENLKRRFAALCLSIANKRTEDQDTCAL